MSDEFVIRNMTRAELDVVLEWAASEQWNPSNVDPCILFELNPSWFFVGLIGDQPICSLTAVVYGKEQYAFLGLYIVKPEFRGKGFGMRIWQHVMNATRNVAYLGLDGVVAQQENYRKSGFEVFHQSERFELPSRIDFSALPISHTVAVRSVGDADVERIIEFDETVFRVDRSAYLRRLLLSTPAVNARCCVLNDKIVGFGAIRPLREGFKVGPLFAGSLDVACALFDALVATVDRAAQVFIDVPMCNDNARRLVNERQMKSMFATARMYARVNDTASLMQTSNVYGISSLEFG